jgi:class 3 adenylate cyclase/predicted ATPase
MQNAWLAYVPRSIAETLAVRGALLPGYARRLTAVALFADVSGFTPMAEALGVAGRRGSEELTDILNSYFTPMIALLEAYGGDVAKFGGDAMTILFPYTSDNRAAVTRRAIQCAVDMQARMSEYAAIQTSAGSFGLAMKAGLARGPILLGVAGDAERLEYIVAGNALDRCAEAEHHATRGEVVLHNELLADAGQVTIVEERGDFSCIHQLQRRAPLLANAPLPPPLPRAAALIAPYVHPLIAHRVARGQSGFVNEHRPVTVLFMHFAGFDYDHDPAVMARLQAYLAAIIACVRRYDGYVARVDMGDKGSKAIVLFGAPVAHEDDPARAVRCALELCHLPGATARIGVNSGVVYAGAVGAPRRQEYTVMGDAVNLAARLMQAAAPGQILAGETTWQAAQQAVDWQSLPPIHVKGKRDPIAIFAPLAARSNNPALRTPTLPLVGRTIELQQITASMDRVGRSAGQIIGLIGAAGVGKSRLVTETVEYAQSQRMAIYAGACLSYSGQISYHGWQAIWRARFAVDPDRSPSDQLAALEAQLAALDPRLGQRAPLLSSLLNLPLPDNEWTASLDPELRNTLLKQLVGECLPTEPTLFVLEDWYWCDPLSQELLDYLVPLIAKRPIGFLVVVRPHTDGSDPFAWCANLPWLTRIQIGELPESAALTLAQLKMNRRFGNEVVPHQRVLEQLVEHSQGHPLYLEELVNLIHARAVDITTPLALNELQLPESLNGLLLSRIDLLSPDEQLTLKAASVIGRQFAPNWLSGAFHQLGPPDLIAQQLRLLAHQELMLQETNTSGTTYVFRHVLLQQVAYESLAFRTRATLHETLANYLEGTYPERQAEYLDLLAYHFGRSDNHDRQRFYFRRAGDAARVAYNNQAALDYYRQLRPLLPASQQAGVLHSMAEIWRLIGDWAAAETACREGMHLAEAANDSRALATCRCTLGAILARTESYAVALEELEQAQAAFVALADQPGLERVLEQLSFAHYQQGDLDQALAYAEQHAAISLALNDQRGHSDALAQIGHVLLERGEELQALNNYMHAYEITEAVGYRRRQALTASDIAAVHWQRNESVTALQWLAQAFTVADEIGYRWVIGMLSGNAGLIYEQAGEYERALACFVRALQIAIEHRNWPDIVTPLTQIASVFTQQGRIKQARALCEQGLQLSLRLDLPYDQCEQLLLLAKIASEQQRWAEVEAYVYQANELAVQIESQQVLFSAELLMLRAAVELQHLTIAEAVQRLESLLSAHETVPQRAAIYVAIWQIDPQRDDARQAAVALYATINSAEARHQFALLTGEQLPVPPALPSLPDLHLGPAPVLKTLLAQMDEMMNDE